MRPAVTASWADDTSGTLHVIGPSMSGSSDNPKTRLYDAALPYGDAWDYSDDFNGVTR